MGKGDKKSKRGKILMGSYGVRRRKRKASYTAPVEAVVVEKPVKARQEKPVAKAKTEVEDVIVEAPVVDLAAEPAEKPARKKPAPKAKPAQKEEGAE